jgi:hypothetical protein
MKVLRSVFQFEHLLTNTWEFATTDQILIVTSRNCGWCVRFTSIWDEIDAALCDTSDVYKTDVIELGGLPVFLDGFRYFFGIDLGPSIGYPSIYVFNATKFTEVPPEIFWDHEAKKFKTENLINYLKGGTQDEIVCE